VTETRKTSNAQKVNTVVIHVHGLLLSVQQSVRALIGLKIRFCRILSWLSSKIGHSTVWCLFCHFIVSVSVWLLCATCICIIV